MNTRLWIQKFFMGGQWSVLFRRHDEKVYREVSHPEGMWVADPFLYEAEGEHYLFAEVFVESRNKGAIGYFRFVNGEPLYQGIAIDQPYHMSYPCIFEYQGTTYMIPETSANRTIELYRAEHFPDQWILDAVLLQGQKWVDTTVRFQNGQPQLFTYRSANGHWVLTQFDMDVSKRKLRVAGEVQYQTNRGRPAGYFFGKGNMLRPAQNCNRMYGEELLVYEVDSLSPYREHESYRVTVSQVTAQKSFDRIHTINFDSTYEVIDVRKDKFDLFHGVKTLTRAYRVK